MTADTWTSVTPCLDEARRLAAHLAVDLIKTGSIPPGDFLAKADLIRRFLSGPGSETSS